MKKIFDNIRLIAVVSLFLPILSFGAWWNPFSSDEDKTKELRISKQYGLPYLPLLVLEKHNLIEKNAVKLGYGDIKVNWVTFRGGAASNDALLSGNVDFISGGVTPFIRLWDKTNGKVKALSGLIQAPIYLNTSNQNIQTLDDFVSNNSRIALPSVKVSIQATLLQIAAAKEYGLDYFETYDHLTVSLKHPDALIALTSGNSEINGHFATEPFATIELNNEKIHNVISSYDIIGNKHTSQLISTSQKFYDENPELAAIVLSSLKEAINWINNNKAAAAKLYVESSKTKEPVELILDIIENPNVVYTTKPLEVETFSDFLYKIKATQTKTESWEELFFEPQSIVGEN